MTCATNGTITICRPGATKVLAEDPQEACWCFKCRKHLPGVWQLVGEVEPSYYGPRWKYRCDGCGGDYMLFPGRQRVREEL